MIKVRFFTLLRLMMGIAEVDIDSGEISVREVLSEAEKITGKMFLNKLLDLKGELKTGTIILVNGKNIYHLNGLETMIRNEDILALFPPGGGG